MEKMLATKTVDISSFDFSYLRELFNIMHKYNIHRIYRISNKDKNFLEAHQILESYSVDDSIIVTNIISFLKDHLPFIYYEFFLRFNLFRFKKALKKFSDKYDIELINRVDIIFKNGRICHFEKLYLDI